MNPDDYLRALNIARHYFEMLGSADYWTTRALGEYILRLFEQGERRPLVLANRAIKLDGSTIGNNGSTVGLSPSNSLRNGPPSNAIGEGGPTDPSARVAPVPSAPNTLPAGR